MKFLSPAILCFMFSVIFFSCADDGVDGLDGQSTLVNVAEEPAGDNCADGGVRIETGIDENLNGMLDIDEVLEVSFVCDGESLADEGQTYLVLSGDISNEEAQAKIDDEAGANTQLIIVKNTSQLTRLEIPQVEQLVELIVEGNQALGTLSFSNLTKIDDAMAISSNTTDSLTIEMNNLMEIAGDLTINSNFGHKLELTSLQTVGSILIQDERASFVLNLPQLESSTRIVIENNRTGLTMSVPNLKNLDFLRIEQNSATEVATNDVAFSFSAPSLEEVTILSVTGNAFFSEIEETREMVLDFSSLQTVSGIMSLSGQSLFTLEMESLENSGSIALINCSNLTSVSMANLSSTSNLSIFGNDNLTSIDLRSLEDVGFDFGIYQNPLLTDINIDAVSSTTDNSFSFNENLFSSTTVNYILARFVSISPPLSGVTINLEQVPTDPAPPTGQGLTDKATLETNGNTVNTD